MINGLCDYVTLALEKCLAAVIIKHAALSIIKNIVPFGIFIAEYNRDTLIKVESPAPHCFYLSRCNFHLAVCEHLTSFRGQVAASAVEI